MRKPYYEDLLYLDPVGAGAGILLGYPPSRGTRFPEASSHKKPGLMTRLLKYLVEHRGIEPLTSGLQSPRSPS